MRRESRGGCYKTAFAVLGRWTWIGSAGESRTYRNLSLLIEAAAAEGWRFDHQVGSFGIFSSQ